MFSIPLEEDGKIAEDKRGEAKEFIIQNLGSTEKLSIISGSFMSKSNVPYFNGNFRTTLTKSFSPWGIKLEWEEPAPEGWITNGSLVKKIEKAPHTIKRITDPYKESHPEWFSTFLDSSGRPNEHYSPELVGQIIQETSKIGYPPEGWKTNNTVSGQLNRSFRLVRILAYKHRESHPEWFKEYLDSAGRAKEHYYPELTSVIIEESSKYKSSPEGWATNNSLAKQLEKDSSTIKRIADQYRTDHPEWFGEYLNISGFLNMHYSPELVEIISKVINENRKVDNQTGRFFSEDGRSFIPLSVFSRDTGINRKTLSKQLEGIDSIRGRGKSGNEVTLYNESDLRSRFVYLTSLPKVDKETKRCVDENGGIWTNITTLQDKFQIHLERLRSLLQDAKTIYGRDAMGRKTILYKEQEVEEILKSRVKESEPISPEEANAELMRFLEIKD